MDNALPLFALVVNIPLIAISFAIAGKGNRLWWLLLLPFVIILSNLLCYLLIQSIPDRLTLFKNLMGYTGLTLLPASILYVTTAFRDFRNKRRKLP